MVANNRTKTTEIASFSTASFSITSAINVSSNVFDNMSVATVSVGANRDDISKQSTNEMDSPNIEDHTTIPHAINAMVSNVPTHANIIEDNQVRRNDSGRKRNDEFNKIIGSIRYKNNSGANTNGVSLEPDQDATIMPNATATTELGIHFNRSIVFHKMIHNNKINKMTISIAAISCSI